MKTKTKSFCLGITLIICLGLLPAVPKMICYAATVQEWLRDGFIVSGNPLKVVTTNDANADAQYSPSGTTKKGLVIQGNGSQTANLFETQFSNGTAIFGITADGASKYTGIATVSAPATSGASNGTIYFDSTLNKFMASLNNGAYAQISTGSGGFPVSSSGAGTPVILSSSSTTITGTGNVIAFANTASGATLTSGTNNTIIGNAADVGANTASSIVVIGSLAKCPTGGVVIGASAGKTGATAARLVVVGTAAARAITTGADNTYIGDSAAPAAVAGQQNVVVGSATCPSMAGATDSDNVFMGYGSGFVVNGSASGRNVGIGSNSATSLTTGVGNIMMGYNNTSHILTTGSFNILIGNASDTNASGTSNAIVIGSGQSSTAQNKASASSILINTNAAINSATTNDLIIESGDTGLRRNVAGVIGPTNGAGGTGDLFIPASVLTAGTMTVTNNSLGRRTITRFDWTNAMVVALGATTTGNVSVCTLPAKTEVRNAFVVITGTAAGTTTLTVSVGRTSAAFIDYIVASNAQVAANTIYGNASGARGTNNTGFDLPSFSGTTVVNAQFVSTVSNLSAVTGSTGSVYLETVTFP